MRQDEWTRDHVRQLREGFNMGWSDEQLGAHLGRTVGGIKSARGRFKLHRRGAEGQPNVAAGMLAARARGEALLTLAFGGHRGFDASAINAYRPAHLPDMHQPRGSSTAWCAE